MFKPLSAFALALAVWVPLTWGAGPAALVERSEPRSFGHTLGDVLERRVVLEADSPYTLTEKSLPKPGRTGAWLELHPPEVRTSSQGGRTRYEIMLAYQVVNSPKELTTLALPEVALEFGGGPQPVHETVPEWPLTVAPITPEYILARGPLDEMQPDAPPPPVPTATLRARLAAYGALALAIVVFLAYRLWGIPFLEATRGPFVRACRDVGRLTKSGGETGCREAIRRIHRAFDETAGHAVFAAEVPEFLAQHPRYAALGPDIERFFELSRQAFFAGVAAEPVRADWLLRFCRQCRSRERGSQ